MIKDKINSFINEMNKQYPYISFDYFETESDDYIIVHNYEDYEDKKFIDFATNLVDKYFWEDGIYNIGFSYNCEFADSVERELCKNKAVEVKASGYVNSVVYEVTKVIGNFFSASEEIIGWDIINKNNQSI